MLKPLVRTYINNASRDAVVPSPSFRTHMMIEVRPCPFVFENPVVDVKLTSAPADHFYRGKKTSQSTPCCCHNQHNREAVRAKSLALLLHYMACRLARERKRLKDESNKVARVGKSDAKSKSVLVRQISTRRAHGHPGRVTNILAPV